MHTSHDWHSMAAEGAGWACRACGICSCHSPEKAAQECDRALLRADSASQDVRP